MSSRSSKIQITCEARVLRFLRTEAGLSMRQAGKLIGVSDSTIAHIETGRMNPPSEERRAKFLEAYGTTEKKFRSLVKRSKVTISPKEQLLEIVERANSSQVDTMLKVARGLCC